MKPYAKYKPSGIEWIGNIPEHWENRKLSRSFNLIGSGTTPKSDNLEYYENGTVNWILTGDLNDSIIYESSKKITESAFQEHSTLKMFPKNTLLIALYGATIGKVGILDIEACTNQACCALSGSDLIDYKFAYYWFIVNRSHIINLSYGGGQPNISQEIIKSLKISCPSLTEQTAITAFLDIKTIELSNAIGKKQQLIELLEEERKAVINEAVAKGINPKVKFKQTGLDWLDKVPEHWKLDKMKRYAYMKGRIGWQGLRQEKFIDEGPYLITGMNFKNGVINWDEVYHISEERYNEAPEIQIKEGDVLFTKDGTIGKILFIDYLPGPTSLNSHLLVIRPLFEYAFYPKFLYFHLQSSPFLTYIELYKTGTTFYGITQEAMEQYKLLLPPIEEQTVIVDFIEKQTAKINCTISQISQEIELLKAYRQSLIFEAVTGKIKIEA